MLACSVIFVVGIIEIISLVKNQYTHFRLNVMEEEMLFSVYSTK